MDSALRSAGSPRQGKAKAPHNTPSRALSVGLIGLCFAVALGSAIGVSSYTFLYADGASYLTNNPTACANCHIMQGHYDAWIKSSHKAVATCNDCHSPHQTIGKFLTKARNGFNHSLAFTTGRFHEPIRITPANRAIAESACRHCHQDIVQLIDAHPREGQALSCLRCHADVGHPK